MDDEDDDERVRTAWHPLLGYVIEKLAAAEIKVVCEFALNQLPQRADMLLLCRAKQVKPARKLTTIFDYALEHTIFEFKGPTDDLSAKDVDRLIGYVGQYMSKYGLLEPGKVCVMVAADRMSEAFVERVKLFGGTFVDTGKGVWRGQLLKGVTLHGVELREAYKRAPSERMLYMFTREFLVNPGGVKLLDGEDWRLYNQLCRLIEQFKKEPRNMALKNIDLASESLQEARAEFVQSLSLDERLVGLTPEQRLIGLTPEERFTGLTLEQVFARYTPEERVKGLTREELLELAHKLQQS